MGITRPVLWIILQCLSASKFLQLHTLMTPFFLIFDMVKCIEISVIMAPVSRLSSHVDSHHMDEYLDLNMR